MLIAVLSLLAAATLSVADQAAVETRVAEIFGPYAHATSATASWDYPIYSAGLTDLIAEWRAVAPADEPDRLSDGDWLCQCQDWSASTFAATLGAGRVLDDDLIEIEVTVDLGFGGPEGVREERLTFKRENGVWLVDDIAAEAFPAGLRHALHETIAEDVSLSGAK